jgi:V8-like Glu-specific endopeptidase
MRASVLARPVVLLLGACVLAVPPSGVTSAAAAPVQSVTTEVTSITASPVARLSSADVLRYWTNERMERARPMGGPKRRGNPSLPPGQQEAFAPAFSGPLVASTAPRVGNVVVPRTVGKLFVRSPWGDQHCSAAIITSRLRNQIITAGHCVNAGTQGGWYRDWLFVPQYDRGRAPHGRWVGFRAYAPRAWTDRGNYSRDYAIIKLRARNGQRIQNALGANGVRVNRPQARTGVRVWGWPAQAPYTGERAVLCSGRTQRHNATDARIPCAMTGGSSGGPWLLPKDRHRHRGLIFAVTSRRTTGTNPQLVATPLPEEFRQLRRNANR